MDATDQIEKFQEFFEINSKKEINDIIRKGLNSLTIDFNDLSKFDTELSDILLDQPEEVIKAGEMALEQFDLMNIKLRLKNLPQSQKVVIKDIRSNHIGKLIFFTGIVRQASDVRPLVVSTKFECPSCGNILTISQKSNEKFREPYICKTCGRKGRFSLLSKTLVDSQRIIIEEAAEDLEGGSQPKRLSVYLREDLVDPKMEKKSIPGNKVLVIGTVKEIPIIQQGGTLSTRFDLVMQANNIQSIREDYSEIAVNEEDVKEIKKLSKDSKIYEKFRKSIAPSIHGHEKIKEALVYQLMGGIKRIKPDQTIRRGDIHILLIGDPGAGKSAMLTFINKAAPKARYVAGKGTSSAGLTAAVVKDEFIKGWALEAGAIVLANKGVCIIDEMDKMSQEDTSALHEGMEQQQISIAKANIQATLRCETSILSAANPRLGRFDPNKIPAEQINLPPALINRFDLIFVIKDTPTKDRDSKIAKHILEEKGINFEPEIPIELMRKYIAYAKQNVTPELTEGAMKKMEDFYVGLRNNGGSSDFSGGKINISDNQQKPIPISPRQLEALIRIAQSSARVRLSKKVTKKDAERAISIMKTYMKGIGVDPETNLFDIDRISTGISHSMRGRLETIRDIIKELWERSKDSKNSEGKSVPLNDIMEKAESRGIKEQEVHDSLDRLNRDGEIYEPKRGFYMPIR